MDKKILVAYATNAGSTVEVADVTVRNWPAKALPSKCAPFERWNPSRLTRRQWWAGR